MQQKTSFWHSAYSNLASMKLTVFLFLALAMGSLIGTLLPQGLTELELQNRFGPRAVWWIQTLGLHDVYHTGWFRVLLVLLSANLIVCSIQRLPKTLKLIKRREERIKPEKLSKFTYHFELTSRLPLNEVELRLPKIIAQEFGPVRTLPDSNAYGGVSEKGRFSPLMVYVVHASVLLILVGALIGSIFGFKGFMNITEGDTAHEVILSSGQGALALPFAVRCDDFDVSFYDTGAPQEFRSDLSIVEDGREVVKRPIRVNDPLSYRGITFYQASYGAVIKNAEVEFQETGSGKVFKINLPYMRPVTIPGTSDQLQLIEYRQDFSHFGPALAIALLREGKESTGSWILVDRPEFHGNRVEDYRVKVLKADQSYFTGLQVKRDPGVWLVWLGFTTLLLGIGSTFCMSHRKIWVWAAPVNPGQSSTKVVVAGRTNKSPLAFEREFKRVCDRMQAGLQSNDPKRTDQV